MYYLSLAATIIILSVFTFGGIGMDRMAYFLDLPSLLLPVLICIPILFSCGLHKDFLAAFRLAAPKHTETGLAQKKRSMEAVLLVMKTMLITGGIVSVYSLILVLAEQSRMQMPSQGMVLAMVSVGLISLFYALLIVLFLLPLHERLKIRILEHTNTAEDR